VTSISLVAGIGCSARQALPSCVISPSDFFGGSFTQAAGNKLIVGRGAGALGTCPARSFELLNASKFWREMRDDTTVQKRVD